MRKKQPAVQVQTFTVTRKIRVVEKRCPQCRKTFVGRLNKKFCSRACVQKESYDRHAEARRAHRRERYKENKEKRPAKTLRKAANTLRPCFLSVEM